MFSLGEHQLFWAVKAAVTSTVAALEVRTVKNEKGKAKLSL